VRAVERAATEHLGRAWACVGFTDLNHRASHPCGIFAAAPSAFGRSFLPRLAAAVRQYA
jgi:hypothetical protein